MCGIVGYTGNTQPGRLAEICHIIRHRGPDAEGLLEQPPIHLGHRRLKIQDLSDAANQPMHSADGRIVLIYNGEIYNAPELRAELEAHGARLRTTSDTEILVELLAREWTDCLARLNGIFAFAAWDTQRQVLLLARDHFGIKPLYYTVVDGEVYFCSELKGLLHFPQVPRQVDRDSLAQYLSFLWVPQPRTILKDVWHLPAGTFAQWSAADKSFAIKPYWSLLDEPSGTDRRPQSELVEEVRAAMDRAVQRQLLSDVPVGAFLSGGLDSSMIVASMAQVQETPVSAYTIALAGGEHGFDGFADDLPYARRMAQQLGATLHEVHVSPRISDMLRDTVYYLDEPIADPAAINAWLICKLAREHGTIVLLSGVGGDELFAGYRRHVASHALRWMGRLPETPVRKVSGALLKVAPAYTSGTGSAYVRRARKMLSVLGQSAERRIVNLWQWSSDATRAALVERDEKSALWEGETHAAFLRSARELSLLKQLMYLDFTTFMPTLNLTYTDRMSMRTSVEVRVPFLDLDLVRLAWGLPDHMLLRRMTTKYILRKAARGRISDDVIDRPKSGFGVPLRGWIAGELTPVVRDLLSPERVARRGVFSPEAVSRVVEDNAAGREDHAYIIWAMLSFELWMESVLEN